MRKGMNARESRSETEPIRRRILGRRNREQAFLLAANRKRTSLKQSRATTIFRAHKLRLFPPGHRRRAFSYLRATPQPSGLKKRQFVAESIGRNRSRQSLLDGKGGRRGRCRRRQSADRNHSRAEVFRSHSPCGERGCAPELDPALALEAVVVGRAAVEHQLGDLHALSG